MLVIGVTEWCEVRVYDSLAAVLSEWGPYPTDLLSDVIMLYGEDGSWFEPIPKYVRRFRFLPWPMELACVELRAMDPSAYGAYGQDTLPMKLHHESESLRPNGHFASLDELRRMYPYSSEG